MDREHLKLIAQVNEFSAAVDTGASRAELETRLTQLIEGFQEHFKSEEGLMQTSTFPGLHVHADEHRKLIGQMSGFRDDLESGAIGLCQALVLFVRVWTEEHMMGLDRGFARFLKDGWANCALGSAAVVTR
jgi:hemerythrin-like metal-binding protein